jgi:hypothetical protein
MQAEQHQRRAGASLSDHFKARFVLSPTINAALYARLHAIKAVSGLPIVAQVTRAVEAWLVARDVAIQDLLIASPLSACLLDLVHRQDSYRTDDGAVVALGIREA